MQQNLLTLHINVMMFTWHHVRR